MALTIGAAPFTRPPGGEYNFDLDQLAPERILYLEDVVNAEPKVTHPQPESPVEF